MLAVKRVRALVAVGLLFFASFALANGARAQSNSELYSIIQQLQKQVQELENKVQNNSNDAKAAKDQAQAAHDAAKASDGGGMKYKWGPSMTFISDDGKFEMHVRGRIQVDFGHVSDSHDFQDRTATEFRRARLGIEGKAWKDVKYKFEIDFADNSVDITDAYVQYTGLKPVKFTFGQFKERVSLDEQTSSRQILVMERAGFTDAYGFQRRIGIGVDANFDSFFIQLGVYGGGDISSNVDDEGYAFAARVFWEPEIGNGGAVHVGGSIMFRDRNNDQDSAEFRYRERPFTHVSGLRYVDTGDLDYIKGDTFYGVEVAGTFGPFHASAEGGWLKADVISGMEAAYNGESSIGLFGAYADIGWFITGESRPLDEGEWDRPKVNNPVFEGGWGAWRIAFRLDYLDLNDFSAGVNGGEQVSYIFGIDWYLNRHTRVLFNYAHTDVSKGNCPAPFVCNYGTADVGPDGKNSVDAVTARFQVDW